VYSLCRLSKLVFFCDFFRAEYALGANISHLSMRYWDIDERHAFEGDHVILRQGYSAVVDHMVETLKQQGASFDYKLNFAVDRVEYARKTTTRPSLGGSRVKQAIPLSDTCCVTSQDDSEGIHCDFVVSCVPLGVLKDAVSTETNDGKLKFDPPLPFSKQDAIECVGFGLLNKVYLQFPTAFWRKASIMDEDQTLFGNASATNPHHYVRSFLCLCFACT
jgi:lysine-specific histone demethylase 1